MDGLYDLGGQMYLLYNTQQKTVLLDTYNES